MKLQVPLTIAAMLWTWLAASAKPRAWTIGMPPPTLASKATARPEARAWAKTGRPVLGQQGLVGRDHVLARGQCRQHELQGRLGSAHGLDDDVDLGIVDQAGRRRWSGGRRRAARPAAFRGRAPLPTSSAPFGPRGGRSGRRARSSSRATPVPTVPRPIMPMVMIHWIHSANPPSRCTESDRTIGDTPTTVLHAGGDVIGPCRRDRSRHYHSAMPTTCLTSLCRESR